MNLRPRGRRVNAAFRRTSLPRPFTMSAFADELSILTDRRVRIEETDALPAHVVGAWFRRADEDLIQFDAALPGIGRIGTVLHEAGHILCGHTSPDDQLEYDRGLCTVLGPGAVQNFGSVQYRSIYRTSFEREAERYARRVLNSLLHSEHGDGLAAEIRGALGNPRDTGW